MAGSPLDRARGRFGLLLTTGDVMRITCIGAAHLSSDGVVLLDVSLDDAGVPDGVDPAWQAKHYLGAPCPGGDEASVNLAHVVAAVEFVAVEMADLPSEKDTPTPDEVVADFGRIAEEPLTILPASSA